MGTAAVAHQYQKSADAVASVPCLLAPCARRCLHLLFLCLLVAFLTPSLPALAISTCPVPGEPPTRLLTATSIDSLGAGIARRNLQLWRQTDSLYEAGVFGRPQTPDARHRARIHFQLRALTGMDCIAEMALQAPGTAQVVESSLLRPFGEDYANYGVYPARFLRAGTVGGGGFHLSYQFPETYRGRISLGGELFRARVEVIGADDGSTTRGLRLSLPTALNKTIDLLYEPVVCGRMRESIVVDRGDTLRVQILESLQGMRVHRAGWHRLGAITVWRSETHGHRDPARLRIGSCAYFPNLVLRLPGFLPDVHLNDLRDADFPMPILRADWYRAKAQAPPGWVAVDAGGSVTPWEGIGPRPRVLEEWFTDL
jgi:hypothetical protein